MSESTLRPTASLFSRCLFDALTMCCLIAGFSAPVARAEHTTFAYAVDHFEITGNAPGSLSDDFNDGILAPWTLLVGTAVEAGGVVTLSNPGWHFLLTFFPEPVLLDISEIRAPSSFDVTDGLGSFTSTSRWDSALLPEPPGGYFAMIFSSSISATEKESLAAFFVNRSPANAGNAGASETGLAVGQSRHVMEDGAVASLESAYFSIDPTRVTGDVFLRLAFDDTTNLVTTSFSTDGGSTFLTPFASVTSSMTGTGGWALSADPSRLLSTVPAHSSKALLVLSLALFALASAYLRPKASM